MTNVIYENNWTELAYENGVWKGPKVPSPEKSFKYGEKLLAVMRENSALVGQVDAITETEDTFGDMLDRCIRCALWLKKQNVKPGDIFGISTGNHLNSIIPIVSSLFIGSVVHPWWDIIKNGEELIQHFIELTKVKIIFTSEVNAKLIQKVISEMNIKLTLVVFGKIEGLESFDDILAAQNPEEVKNFECTKIDSSDHPALILQTSGTTAKPKGVLLSYRSVANRRNLVPKKLMHRSTGMNFSTISWISGVTHRLSAIEVGSKFVVFYGLSLSESFKLIKEHQVEWITAGTPVMTLMSIDPIFKQHDFSCIKYIGFGGSTVTKRVHEFLETTFPYAPIFFCYGMTETGIAMLRKERKHPSNSCGIVTKNIEIKIMNEDRSTVLEPNKEGELWVKSPLRMLCYFNNPKSTAETIDGDGWLHTGDLGYYRKDGIFFITGRIKDLIKGNYCHIHPAPIEKEILKHPGVFEVAVVGKLHDLDVELPIAFVVKHQGANVNEEEIVELVKSNMPERFRLLGGAQFLDDLPRTTNGKVAKNVLRQITLHIQIPSKLSEYNNNHAKICLQKYQHM